MRFGFVVTTFAVTASFMSTVDAVTKQQCEIHQGAAPNFTPKCFVCHWDPDEQKYTSDCRTRAGNQHLGNDAQEEDYVYCFAGPGSWGSFYAAADLPHDLNLDNCETPPSSPPPSPPVALGKLPIAHWVNIA